MDARLATSTRCKVPAAGHGDPGPPAPCPPNAPEFVRNVTSLMIAGRRGQLPVSALPVDGTCPTGTTKWEKRNIALEIPVWDEKICIQCGKCVLVCPHAVIRGKIYEPDAAQRAGRVQIGRRHAGRTARKCKYTLQVAPEDCTGCRLCVEVCPVKNKSETRLKAINMAAAGPLRDAERANWDFFLNIPDPRPQLGCGPKASRTCSSWSRCSSSPAPAPAAAKRPT